MTTRHITKDKGDLAVAKAIAHLREHNIRVCLPISEHLPFDLIAVMPDMTTLRRVQVKYRKLKEEDHAVHLLFRSNYYDSKKIYSKYVDLGELDVYAVYNPDRDETFYLRIDEIPENGRGVVFRYDKPKNNQKKGVRLINNYVVPLRIALNIIPQPAVRRMVHEEDEVAISHVITHLLKQGIQPVIANTQYLPFDLIAVMPDMRTLHRIRVGWECVQTTPYADYYALYLPESKSVVYIPANLLQAGETMVTAKNVESCLMSLVTG